MELHTVSSDITNPTIPAFSVNPEVAVTEAFKVDTSKGSCRSELSSQWHTRPADQRFLNLNDLSAQVNLLAGESRSTVVDVRDIRVLSDSSDPDSISFILPDSDIPVEPNHWSFSQTCGLLGVPTGYLRKLPGQLSAINVQYAMKTFRQEAVKCYTRHNGSHELRAATGPDYGRIYDHELVSAVQTIAGNGTGDTRWKIPGQLNWSNGTYDPFHAVTLDSTTLYASDRDVFMFLVDDTHPIEIGKLPNGDPDLIFRGFYCWNSEVGSKTCGMATFYLRGICMNRMMWGVENFETMTIRHSKNAPARFGHEARPALESFANHDTGKLLYGINQARSAIVAKTDDDRTEFLTRRGFNKQEASKVLEAVLTEEGKKAESVWDFVQGITAVARGQTHQDERVDFEMKAKKILDRVAA